MNYENLESVKFPKPEIVHSEIKVQYITKKIIKDNKIWGKKIYSSSFSKNGVGIEANA